MLFATENSPRPTTLKQGGRGKRLAVVALAAFLLAMGQTVFASSTVYFSDTGNESPICVTGYIEVAVWRHLGATL